MGKRKKPLERDALMLRTKAFSCLARDTERPANIQAGLEMAGFLELFHPELSDEEKRELIQDVKNRR